MRTVVAWDIETCPQPLDSLSEMQRKRYERELKYKLNQKPDMDEGEASRLVRSVHPFLGWICCISAVSGTLEGGPNKPVSWMAEDPDEEGALLERFWEAVASFPPDTVWTTFNGKRFDVPFVEARSVRHGLMPSRRDLLDTYPYKHRPHADLARLWPVHYALGGLCSLLGVPSPKGAIDGSQVARCVDEGRIDAVARYCEEDVVATFACLRAVPSIAGCTEAGTKSRVRHSMSAVA